MIQEPERISFKVVVALCDALDVTPKDLITYTATDTKIVRQHRKAADEDVPEMRNYRSVRTRIVEDHD